MKFQFFRFYLNLSFTFNPIFFGKFQLFCIIPVFYLKNFPYFSMNCLWGAPCTATYKDAPHACAKVAIDGKQ